MICAPRGTARALLARRWSRIVFGAATACASLGVPCATAPAQGLAAAAITGLVRNNRREPIPRARVVLRNDATGLLRERQTDGAGRFVFDELPPGGPYQLEADLLGFAPSRRKTDIILGLGERFTVELVLGSAVTTTLPVVSVRGARQAQPAGPAFSMGDAVVHGVPLASRNFVGLFAAIPQATGPTTVASVGGQHSGLNAIQIDGAISGDVYGVTRTPGEAAGAKSISLEALDQVQVLVAPFDIRQGGFSGALINGITRSGSNRWQASVFASMQDQALVGPDPTGARSGPFDVLQYGVTLGGPLVRDRLQLFVAADLQRSRTLFVGPAASDPQTGISDSTAARAAAAFRNVYRLDAGSADAPVLDQPDRSVFAKLTWQPSSRHHVELSHNWVDASREGLGRELRRSPRRDGWQLSGSGSVVAAVVHTTRLRVASTVGSASNELIVGAQTIDEDRSSVLRAPLLLVQGDVEGNYLAGGSVVNSNGTVLDQHVIEVTDNVTIPFGSHEVTVGVHAEWYRFLDNLFVGSWGVWTFPNVDALEQRRPSRYEVALPLREGGPVADFGAGQLAGYVQDRWSPSDRLSITAGVRADRSHSDVPERNPTLASSATLGAGYAGRFAHATQLSPRLGASWRLTDRRPVTLRAGAGLFTSRPPQTWIGGAFLTDGMNQRQLVCVGQAGVPEPELPLDVDDLPTQCLSGPPAAPPPAAATYIADSFRPPQVIKAVLGIDADMGRGVSASLDVVTTTGRRQAYLRDVNLREIGTSAEGRAMYGTILSATQVSPARRDPALAQVLEVSGRGGDRSVAVSLTAAKHWRNGSLAQAGYQWSRATDAMIHRNPNATLAYANSPIDGTIDDRRRTRSGLDVPHNFVATVVGRLPHSMDASLLFRAQSGRPYAYVTSGDANGDSVTTNDLFYVPRDAGDITLANPTHYGALHRFIESEPCMREQRGRTMARNSCRNPAVVTLDARLAKRVSMRASQALEVSLDIFNVPNLLDRDWGLVKETAAREQLPLINIAGWDAVANRPAYRVPTNADSRAVLPRRRAVVVDASRWQIQLGARYRLR